VTVVDSDGAFTVTQEQGTDSVRILPSGELDMFTAPILDAALRAAESAAPRRIVVDLGRLLFMDCRSLRVLLRAHERAGKGGWGLSVVHPAGEVRRILELTGTAQTLSDGKHDADPSPLSPATARPTERSLPDLSSDRSVTGGEPA
jgi:anti-sigma B factor antagonist